MEIRHPPPGPGSDEGGRRIDDATHGGAGPGLLVQLLPLRSRSETNRGSRHGVARRDPAYRAGVAVLRAAAHHRRVAPPGLDGNPKRVYRLMREDNLLCVRRRKFLITTDSNHGRRIYPNLARELVLTGVNQLWIADLTYIRLREEFVFLAAILTPSRAG